ncbi:MAG: chorismate-binding protein [Candidatus Marinimicrobia bacterium]|nr:chorismate-binding protein [Candidatus Neomarinimicrobiota bacterium]
MITESKTGKIVALRDLWKAAIKVNASVAMWRLPASSSVHFLVDFSNTPAKGRLNLQTKEPGFAVSPFLSPEDNESIYLKADLHMTFVGSGDKIEESQNVPASFWSIVNGQKESASIPYHLNIRPDTKISGEKDHFIRMVKNGIRAIECGEFAKVVMARTLDEPLIKNFDIVDQFCRLEKAHPAAFINLVSIPGRGTWIGASPELLVETLGNRNFRTVSLAGTQPFPEDGDLKDAAWNQKEIEEQAMVSRYVIEQFKTIRLREFEESGPRTVRAGSMIHLKTEYMVDMENTNFPELGTVMLHLLHPTSSVCGMPKFPALQFIVANEHLNREFYSGFLGPVNINGNTQLYVNLRCMQILRTRAVMYAGAGITHDSDPEKEWDETALKCQTLLDVMNRDS